MTTSRLLFWSVAMLLTLNVPVFAQTETAVFDQPGHRELYQQLLAELRCLVCQNQNLADSNADLAKDLRSKTESMVRAGKSREEIIEYMANRYGDFVLYRPPLKNTTVVLWLSPFLLLLGIVLIAAVKIRRTARATPPVIPDEQLRRVKSIFDQAEK